MANEYTEAEKMIFASYVNLEVAAMQADNEICKANGRPPKYDSRDFGKAIQYAHNTMRGNGW